MGNRCESCSKFVSLENGEPEITTDFTFCFNDPVKPDAATLEGAVTLARLCGECGDELKTCEYSFEQEIEVGFVGPEAWAKMLLHVGEGHDLEVECEEPEAEEGGGSRYKKNEITVTVDYAVRCSCQPEGEEPLFSSTLEESHAASDFEEV